ncbi:hypothetical protein [Bradyrhizobium sp. LA6.7]|uniref:hypothetical protein n=1 Tax=unclassified Bradyrhizobium TaxID=2631580 RepID=UPI003398CC9C
MMPVLSQRWPREVVVDNCDGTVSLLQDVGSIDWRNVRGRHAGDVIRKPAWRAPVVPEAA